MKVKMLYGHPPHSVKIRGKRARPSVYNPFGTLGHIQGLNKLHNMYTKSYDVQWKFILGTWRCLQPLKNIVFDDRDKRTKRLDEPQQKFQNG